MTTFWAYPECTPNSVCFYADGGSGDYDLVDTDNANAIIDQITGGSTDGIICFNQTINNATTATLNLDVRDVNNTEVPGCLTGSPVTINIPTCTSPCPVSDTFLACPAVCNGNNATYTVCFYADGGSGDYDLVDTDNANAVIDQITGGSTNGIICFNQTIVNATTATLNLDIRDVSNTNDPNCLTGVPVTVTVPACCSISTGTWSN